MYTRMMDRKLTNKYDRRQRLDSCDSLPGPLVGRLPWLDPKTGAGSDSVNTAYVIDWHLHSSWVRKQVGLTLHWG